MPPAARTEHASAALTLTRVLRTTRLVRSVGVAWALGILALDLVSFPRFVFEWHRGAPLALSTAAMAFFWASCALWAGGFRIGYRDVAPQIILREEMPGKFWRGIIISLASGTALVLVGVIRSHL